MKASEARHATATDGTRIVFETLGDGPSRIALCHSLAMDRHFWKPVAERLADDATVILWDARGHGESGRPAGPYTVELFADDLAAVLDALGWQGAIVGGASMGGCVSLAFAGRHAARLEGLGLFDTTAWYGPDAVDAWSGRAQTARRDGLPGMVDFQLTRWFTERFRELQPAVVERCVRTFLANDMNAYAECCLLMGRADLRAVLTQIDVPVQIAVGAEDFATPPAMAKALRDGIAGAELDIIEHGRHLTPLEYPDRIVGQLRRIIERRQS